MGRTRYPNRVRMSLMTWSVREDSTRLCHPSSRCAGSFLWLGLVCHSKYYAARISKVSDGNFPYPSLNPIVHSSNLAYSRTRSMSKMQIGSPCSHEQLASIAVFLGHQDCFWFGDMMLMTECFFGVK